MKRLAVAAVVVWSLCAQSQPPSPSPPKATQQKQNKAAAKQGKREPDNAATDRLTAAIDQLTAEIKTGKQQASTDHAKQSAPIYQGLNIPDWIIAAFTVVLATVGYFQLRAISKQADYMRDALAETKKAAEAAESSAKTAGDALASVREQTGFTKQAAQAASDNAAAAKATAQSIVNTERAWLVIQRVEGEGISPVGFRFKNLGRTPAWITELRVGFYSSTNELVGTVDYNDMFSWPLPLSEAVAPSEETRGFVIHLDGQRLIPTGKADAITSGQLVMSLHGILRYRDIFEEIRQTTFSYVAQFRPSSSALSWDVTGPPEANQNT